VIFFTLNPVNRATMKLTDSQTKTIADFLATADVDTLHRACRINTHADLPQYFGRGKRGDNSDFVFAARRLLAGVGLYFDFDRGESDARQLWIILRKLPHRISERIGELERPFREMVAEIQQDQLKSDRKAERKAFRDKYGTKCDCCKVKRTKLIHPLLDVLCCDACQHGRTKYGMIYRTHAKAEYGITDDDLAALPSVEVANRHNPAGPAARLYLRSAVQTMAVA